MWVDGRFVTEHDGGYTPFYVDLTPYLRPGRPATLTVRVWDACDADTLLGKQVDEWYTHSGGIWQPVWLEGRPGGLHRPGPHHPAPGDGAGQLRRRRGRHRGGRRRGLRGGGDFGGRGLPPGRDTVEVKPGRTTVNWRCGAASRGPGRRRARTSTTAWSPSPPNSLRATGAWGRRPHTPSNKKKTQPGTPGTRCPRPGWGTRCAPTSGCARWAAGAGGASPTSTSCSTGPRSTCAGRWTRPSTRTACTPTPPTPPSGPTCRRPRPWASTCCAATSRSTTPATTTGATASACS